MTAEENVVRVREAYDAYTHGETARLLDLVDPDLEWTYLDPATVDALPQTCHGQIVALRACRTRAEAMAFAGIAEGPSDNRTG